MPIFQNSIKKKTVTKTKYYWDIDTSFAKFKEIFNPFEKSNNKENLTK